MKMIKEQIPSESRLWYNDWISSHNLGKVLDVGKSWFWDYGFDTIDTNEKLNPTIIGDICNSNIPDNSYDTVLCNGMYECVSDPQKMIDECLRIAKKQVLFGFVGKDYKRYKNNWKYFDFKEKIPFTHKHNFGLEYHFFICKK